MGDGIDLLILEDNPALHGILVAVAKDNGLDVAGFKSGVAALEYLYGSSELPRAYLIDMRIVGSSAEEKSSEAIFRYVERHGDTTYFRFNTGDYSDHDKGVHARTGAPVFIKSHNDDKRFIEELARLKATTGTPPTEPSAS